MMNDECYMRRCFELAQRGAGCVSPNPMVGALLVCDGKIIGEGWHHAYGKAHAEVNCLDAVKPEDQHLIQDSTLYCSLEPCSHFGKTPPCADLILQKKVPRVVVSNIDPNPQVAGKGLAKLREAGVAVSEGVLAAEGRWVNRFFFTWISRHRPFVILKWAQSRDGFLGKEAEKTAISGPVVQRLVHRWRAESDAILVGANTARVDNPRLDVRHYFGKNPLRVLLDGSGTVPVEQHLLSDSAPTLVFGPIRPKVPGNKTFFPSETQASLSSVLDVLQTKKCATLLVEGGAQVLNQFLALGLWDELRIIENPSRIGEGIEAPRIPVGAIEREEYCLGTDVISIFSKHT